MASEEEATANARGVHDVSHDADVALALAAGRGDRDALIRLDALLRESVRRATARIDASAAFADLVAQDLRTRLLFGDPPRIHEYAGRGPLAAWLVIAARRIALNLRRGHDASRRADLPSQVRLVVDAPEVAILRARYLGDFEDALRKALGRLSSRERTALCLHLRDGVRGTQLASMFGISNATVTRLLAHARRVLLVETMSELRARLGITASEVKSIAETLYAHADVSLVRLLQEP